MSFCKDCITGVIHEGTPSGTTETIDGVEVYIATPEIDYPKDKAVLFLPDIFGLALVNNKLLADAFAKNGFKTYLIDYLNGDPVPADFLGGKFDLGAWFPNHGQDKTRPSLDKVMNALKAQGITTFGATGYCFGGRYVFDLAFDDLIKVGSTSHPSLLQKPDDLEKYAAKAKAPLQLNTCEVDEQFPIEAQEMADKILGGGKFAPGYERTYWPGCSHGFAVRGDISIPEVKAGKEGSFKATVEWLIKYL